jgi:sigma-B regulation protein RsbU (phosphoserine phosphatase)
MLKSKGIAFKLSVYTLSITILILGTVVLFNYLVTKEIILEDVQELTKHITYENMNKIEDVMNKVEMLPKNISYLLENSNVTDAELHELIRMGIENNIEIFGSTIAFDKPGFINNNKLYAPYYYKGDSKLEYVDLANVNDYQDQSWYSVPQKNKKPVWSEPYFDEGGGNILMTTYSYPFYSIESGNREFAGIVTADISLDWLQDVMASIKIFDTGYALLISNDGTFVTHPNKDNIEKNIYDIAEQNNDIEMKRVFDIMMQDKEGFIMTRSAYLEADVGIFYAPLKSSGWSIAVIFPEDELYARLHELNGILLLIVVCGLLAFLAAVIIFSKKFTRPLGVLAAATKDISKGNFELHLPKLSSNDEVAVLAKSMDHMLKELKKYVHELQETTSAKERIESELRIANEIQMGMVPKTFPPFPDTPEINIYAELHSAKEVGGDLYDFFFLDESHLLITIGDVSGKGVPASLLMAVTRTLLRSKAVSGMKPDELINTLNNSLCEDNESRLFVTYFLCIVNLNSGQMDYASAGHNIPYLLKSDKKVSPLDIAPAYPLGISNKIDYLPGKTTLSPGDKLFLYTDGIPEAMNDKEEMFEDDRLIKSLEENINENGHKLTRNIFNIVDDFVMGEPQYDDMTIVVFEYLKKLGP